MDEVYYVYGFIIVVILIIAGCQTVTEEIDKSRKHEIELLRLRTQVYRIEEGK